MQYQSCDCILQGMQSPKIGLILALEGVVFHYIYLVKVLLGSDTVHDDISV